MILSNLAARLRKHGLTVVETPGWASRGYAPPGESPRDLREVRGVLWHHTATNRARFTADAPTLAMCIEGRPDVAGPLCNIVFGRSGTVYLVAAGLANHAGAGAWHNIPRDLGNYYLIGIEMESSGVAPWDWTADQLRVAPYLGAALELEYLQHLPPELRLQIGHLEYSSQGKIDPAGWPGGMDGLRAQINKVLAGGGTITPAGYSPAQTGDEFDMATVQEVVTALWRHPVRRVVNGKTVEVSAIQELADAKTLALLAVEQSGPIRRGGKLVSLRQEVADCKTMLLAQGKLLEELAARQGVEPEEVKRILRAAAAEALADVSLVSKLELKGEADGQV